MKAEIKPRIDIEGRTKLETVIPLSTPYLVFLDPSDLCNQQCKFCPTGNVKMIRKIRKQQIMPLDLYKKIIDDLCTMPEPIKTLRLYSDGEPLLNVSFPKMVEYAASTGRFELLDTTTNGLLLDEEVNAELISAGLDKIFLSVPQTYTKRYVEVVKDLYVSSRLSSRLQIYTKIIGDGLSVNETDRFMDDFGDISDRIFIENLSPCWPLFNVDISTWGKGIYNQPLPERGVEVCPYLFYSLKINSDGTVSTCFLDWTHQMLLGDLKKESFIDIWNGKLLRDYHIMHLSHGRSLIKFCSNCGQLRYGAPDNIDPFASELLKKI